MSWLVPVSNEDDNSKAHKESSEASHTHEKIMSSMYSLCNPCYLNAVMWIQREMVVELSTQWFVSWNVLICSGGKGRFGLTGIGSLMMGYCADGTSEGNEFTCWWLCGDWIGELRTSIDSNHWLIDRLCYWLIDWLALLLFPPLLHSPTVPQTQWE